MHRDHFFSEEIKLPNALWEGVVLTEGRSGSECEGDEVIYQGAGSWRDVLESLPRYSVQESTALEPRKG